MISYYTGEMARDSAPRCRRQCMAMAFESPPGPLPPPGLASVVIRSFHRPPHSRTNYNNIFHLLHVTESLGTVRRRVWENVLDIHVSSLGSSRLCMTLCITKSQLAPPNICYRLASVIAVRKQCLDQVRYLICLKLKPQLSLRPQILDVCQ